MRTCRFTTEQLEEKARALRRWAAGRGRAYKFTYFPAWEYRDELRSEAEMIDELIDFRLAKKLRDAFADTIEKAMAEVGLEHEEEAYEDYPRDRNANADMG